MWHVSASIVMYAASFEHTYGACMIHVLLSFSKFHTCIRKYAVRVIHVAVSIYLASMKTMYFPCISKYRLCAGGYRSRWTISAA